MTIYLVETTSFSGELFQVRVHESHSILKNSYNTECHNCWGCSCHSPDILDLPCQNSVKVENTPNGIEESVSLQAQRYGKQIRILEDLGFREDSGRIHAAWTSFRMQLHNPSLLNIASDSYHKAYCQ